MPSFVEQPDDFFISTIASIRKRCVLVIVPGFYVGAKIE